MRIDIAMNHLNQVRDQGSNHLTEETPVAGSQAFVPSANSEPAIDLPTNHNNQGTNWTPETLETKPTQDSPSDANTFISPDSDLSRQWDAMIREERGHRPSDSHNNRGSSDDHNGHRKQDETQNWLNQPESTSDDPTSSKNSGHAS